MVALVREDCSTAAWLARPSLQLILRVLSAEGGAARCVGGCVRDHLRGQDAPDTDVDIATSLAPEAVTKRLEAEGIKVVPRGIAFGTVLAVAHNDSTADLYEITTLREDVQTDGRHAEVAFIDDWGRDASRRDFGINALYCDAAGRVYDPLGNGLADLAARRVRFIGDADQRIAEDYLRVLRFFRFYAGFAEPASAPDAEAIAACRRGREGLARLSGERVQSEMLKLLALPRAVAALEAMEQAEITDSLFGFVPSALSRVAGLCRLADAVAEARDPFLRLAGLLVGAEVKSIAKRWRLSKAQNARLKSAVQLPALSLDIGEAEILRLLYANGRQAVCDWLVLSMAESPETLADWRALLDLVRAISIPRFPLNGKMMQEAGLAPGPHMGVVAKRVEAWWVAEGFPDADALAEQLNRAIADTK